MMRRQRPLRRRALRVALTATALVGALLLVLLTVTDLLVARNLTSGIDDQLRERLDRPLLPIEQALSGESADGDFDAPVLEWLITPRRIVTTDPSVPTLPGSLQDVTSPLSAAFSGGQFRFAGATRSDGDHLVVAASLLPVSNAVDTLLLTEAVATPALLLVVLLGTFLVGQRVADPIERMRQRQLAFTADASHELRTPLSVIRAETSLARAGTLQEARQALLRVDEEAGRMRRIVDDLLWLARFQAEPQRHERVPVDLATMATVAVQRFQAVAARRSIVLTAEVVPEQAVQIVAPPDWIDHTVGILLDNACRYCPVGGEVIVAVRGGAGRAELAVSDTGPGIAPADLERLFERFHRGTQDGDGEGEGVGLGLAIADAIVRATEGRWDVTDRTGGGTRFAISWPAEMPA